MVRAENLRVEKFQAQEIVRIRHRRSIAYSVRFCVSMYCLKYLQGMRRNARIPLLGLDKCSNIFPLIAFAISRSLQAGLVSAITNCLLYKARHVLSQWHVLDAASNNIAISDGDDVCHAVAESITVPVNVLSFTLFRGPRAAKARIACTAMYSPGTLKVSNMTSAVYSRFSGVFKGGSVSSM